MVDEWVVRMVATMVEMKEKLMDGMTVEPRVVKKAERKVVL